MAKVSCATFGSVGARGSKLSAISIQEGYRAAIAMRTDLLASSLHALINAEPGKTTTR